MAMSVLWTYRRVSLSYIISPLLRLYTKAIYALHFSGYAATISIIGQSLPYIIDYTRIIYKHNSSTGFCGV